MLEQNGLNSLLITHATISLGSYNHGVIINLWHFIRQHLNIVLTEEYAQYSFDLHKCKVLSHAGMHPTTETEVGIRGGFMFFSARSETVWIEDVRFLKDVGEAHTYTRADEDHVIFGYGILFAPSVDLN